MDDRQKLTSFHLTVRLYFVSGRMLKLWRSILRNIKVKIRVRILRLVLSRLASVLETNSISSPLFFI